MILGTIRYPSRYGGLGQGVKAGLKYLAEHDLSALPLGRHVIDGDTVFFDVAEAMTTAAGETPLFEAHRRYLDIHVTISGEEWFGYAMVSTLEEAEPYDQETDVARYRGEGVYLQAPPGHFILFMPEDAHKPKIYFKEAGLVRKLVLKVKLPE
ncbi:MAG: YhcH/YjgK/YiaL family protein [Synergistaceae bacterium]|nr:YhcH/YjgK/YiaL family protein [Synergistaceae bacterium]